MINKDINNKLKSILNKVNLSEFLFNKILEYLELILMKNKELNLISRKLDVTDILQDHFYDCLVGWKYFEDYSSITDIGTGSGLPGILLAIIFPQKKIYLVEKSPKKCSFLSFVKKELQLENTAIINKLITDYKIESDIVTCRAFKPIPVILELTASFYKNKNSYILYKGRIDKINEEIQEAKKKYNFKYKINKIKDITEKERHIVIIN